MLIIYEFQFTFLMDVCLNPIIYFSIIYATIWSLIFTASSHMVPLPRFYFSNHVPTARTSILVIHALYFFPYMVFEYRHNIRNKLLSTEIPSLIPYLEQKKKRSTNLIRFLRIFFSFFSSFFWKGGMGVGDGVGGQQLR